MLPTGAAGLRMALLHAPGFEHGSRRTQSRRCTQAGPSHAEQQPLVPAIKKLTWLVVY